jgi:Flp pilus assembly protein TadB
VVATSRRRQPVSGKRERIAQRLVFVFKEENEKEERRERRRTAADHLRFQRRKQKEKMGKTEDTMGLTFLFLFFSGKRSLFTALDLFQEIQP